MKICKTFVFVVLLAFLSFYSVGCGKNKYDNSKETIKNTEVTSTTIKSGEKATNTEYTSETFIESSSEMLPRSTEKISEKKASIEKFDENTNQKEEQYHDDNDIIFPEQNFKDNTIESKENIKPDNKKVTDIIKGEVSETVTSTTKISERSKSTTVKTTTKQIKTEKRIELPEVNF